MAGTVGPHSPRSHLGQPVTACYLPVTRCRPAPPVIPYGAICLRESPHFRLNSDPQSRTFTDRIRNLLANSTRQLIRSVFEQTQPHGHLKQIFLEHGFVSVEFLDHAIVGYPPHPFWFWRQIPLVRVEAANRTKSRSDLCLALMRPRVTVHELRSVPEPKYSATGACLRSIAPISRLVVSRCPRVRPFRTLSMMAPRAAFGVLALSMMLKAGLTVSRSQPCTS